MDRIWQWAWDRYGSSYSGALAVVSFVVVAPIYLFMSLLVVAYEGSSRYLTAAAVSVAAVPVLMAVTIPQALGHLRLAERWAAGQDVDRATALSATYILARSMVIRAMIGTAIWAAVLLVCVGAMAGATASRMVQYAIIGGAVGSPFS